MGENICKYCDQHGINLQNVQTAHTAHEPLWAEEPGGLQAMGWQRVGHGSATEHMQPSVIKNQTTKPKNTLLVGI